MKKLTETQNLTASALLSGMDRKTARRYRDNGSLPSESAKPHSWRTRPNPFQEVWADIEALITQNPGLQAKTIFEYLVREHPDRFQAGQLRTLQRHLKGWRARKGPDKEVMFAQEHRPGELSASDFTHMSTLNVTLCGQAYPHMVYHFVLTYSNWESVTLCPSESFESLSLGFQNAAFELSGMTARHRTDNLGAAIRDLGDGELFTARYGALTRHYGVRPERIQPGESHENGDAEQSHRRFKEAVDQALMLRGSRDFSGVTAYQEFLKKVVKERNGTRGARLLEDMAHLKSLPATRLPEYRTLDVTVTTFSTIRVLFNTYSVPSRLIGEKVRVHLHAAHLDVFHGSKRMDTLPRLRGRQGHHIQYRHVIDSLVKKPGAFASYRYREDLYPTTTFRMYYDLLLRRHGHKRGVRQYLRVLLLAAGNGEARVEAALREGLRGGAATFEHVEALVLSERPLEAVSMGQVADVDLPLYDSLFTSVPGEARDGGAA
jgi:hypothetical protein